MLADSGDNGSTPFVNALKCPHILLLLFASACHVCELEPLDRIGLNTWL